MLKSVLRTPWFAAAAFALAAVVHADVLPDDRADVLWHVYDGGGVTVTGPSVLVRKKVNNSLSFAANYYVDTISSASIDVVTQASPMCKRACYTEQRKQESLSANYLHGNTMYSAGYIASIEPDYHAKTAFASISQTMFGDLTTVSFGFTRGWDDVGDRDHSSGVVDWKGTADRRNWQFGVSQVLTRNLLLALNDEVTESDGYLANPYRSVRYITGDTFAWGPEAYPDTHMGNAISPDLKYYLPYRASLDGNYRFYSDSWGIRAHTFTLGYTQPVATSWTLDATARYYRQTHATFYSDLFPYVDSQNFMSRDRELAQFQSLTLGVGATWQFQPSWPHWVEKGTLNASWDRIHIGYDDFRDARVSGAPQSEPLYAFDANVYQFFISFWY